MNLEIIETQMETYNREICATDLEGNSMVVVRCYSVIKDSEVSCHVEVVDQYKQFVKANLDGIQEQVDLFIEEARGRAKSRGMLFAL